MEVTKEALQSEIKEQAKAAAKEALTEGQYAEKMAELETKYNTAEERAEKMSESIEKVKEVILEHKGVQEERIARETADKKFSLATLSQSERDAVNTGLLNRIRMSAGEGAFEFATTGVENLYQDYLSTTLDFLDNRHGWVALVNATQVSGRAVKRSVRPRAVFGAIAAGTTRPRSVTTRNYEFTGFSVPIVTLATVLEYDYDDLADSEIDIMGESQLSLDEGYNEYLSENFLGGSGTNAFLGMFNTNNGALITHAKTGSQPDDTISAANLDGMNARLVSGSRARAGLFTSTTAWAEMLSTLADRASTDNPVIQSRNGEWFYRGINPIYIDDNMPALGSAGDVAFGDLSKYRLYVSRGMTVTTQNDVDNHQVKAEYSIRSGAGPTVNNVLGTGAAALGAFVRLAAR